MRRQHTAEKYWAAAATVTGWVSTFGSAALDARHHFELGAAKFLDLEAGRGATAHTAVVDRHRDLPSRRGTRRDVDLEIEPADGVQIDGAVADLVPERVVRRRQRAVCAVPSGEIAESDATRTRRNQPLTCTVSPGR